MIVFRRPNKFNASLDGFIEMKFERFGRLILSHRMMVLTLVLLFSVVAIAGVLRVDFDSNPRSILQQSEEDSQRLEEFFSDFGSDDDDVLVIIHGGNFFEEDFGSSLQRFSEKAPLIDGVKSVHSAVDLPSPVEPGRLIRDTILDGLISPEETRTMIIGHPFVIGNLLSQDEKTLLVSAKLDSGQAEVERNGKVLDELRSLAHECFEGMDLEISLAGHVPIRVENLVGLKREFVRTMGLAAVIALVIAWCLFRGFLQMLIVSSGAVTSVVWTLGMMGWFGMKIDSISMPLPTLLFVIAFGSSVHLLIDIIRSRKEGMPAIEASVLAFRHLGLPCLLTSLTTVIGFGSLILAQTESVQRFGIASAVGAILGLIANLLIIPLLASYLRVGKGRSDREIGGESGHRLARIGVVILARSKGIVILGLVLSGVLIYFASKLEADIFWTETLPKDSETTRAMKRSDEVFGGALKGYVVIEWEETIDADSAELSEVLVDVHELIDAQPLLSNPLSALTMMEAGMSRGLSEAGTRYIRPQLRRAAVSMNVPDVGAATMEPVFDALDSQLGELASRRPGFSFRVEGSVVVASQNITLIIEDLIRSLSFASVAVFLVLLFGLRSPVLALVSILPNAFPLLLNAGALSLLGMPLQITSVLTFSICLGIAVDDTVHFLMRYLRERREGTSIEKAILNAFERVGAALLVTTLIIGGGFAAAMASEMPALVLFGALSCSALFSALIGDLVLLPALLKVVESRFSGGSEKIPASDTADNA